MSLDQIKADSEGLADLCPEHLRQSIRHVQRNCDIDCNDHEEEASWDACKQPDGYDGARMARALASIPRLIKAVEAVLAVADSPDQTLVKPKGDKVFHVEAHRIRAAITTALGGE